VQELLTIEIGKDKKEKAKGIGGVESCSMGVLTYSYFAFVYVGLCRIFADGILSGPSQRYSAKNDRHTQA
jgi:hypothetical protein